MNQIMAFIKRIILISTIAVFALISFYGCKDNNPGNNNFENGFEYVDLGLSVNWATYNVGATAPEDYGNYYAWGETTTKSSYTFDTFKFVNGGDEVSNITFSKYNTSKQHGVVDNKGILDPQDDVAHIKWEGSWRMPTQTEWNELIENCTWTVTILNDVEGYLGTSKKEGYTDRSIFIPSAGYRANTDLDYVGSYGFYWTSSLDTQDPINAWYSLVAGTSARLPRAVGLPIRAVCPSKINLTSVAADSKIKIGGRSTWAYYEPDKPFSFGGNADYFDRVQMIGTKSKENRYSFRIRCKSIYEPKFYDVQGFTLQSNGNILSPSHGPIELGFYALRDHFDICEIKYIKYIDENTLEVVVDDYYHENDVSIIFRKKRELRNKSIF